jgi:hypothetical protein
MLAQLRPGEMRYDLSVPPQLLHPASALQLYGATLGALVLHARARAHAPRRVARVTPQRRTRARRALNSKLSAARSTRVLSVRLLAA